MKLGLIRTLLITIPVSLVLVPMGSATSAYSFQMICSENNPSSTQGIAQAGWNWTINGQPINGGGVNCSLADGGSTVTGSGSVPPNVNGITGGILVERGTCQKLVFGSRSFTGSGGVSFSLKASCEADPSNSGPLTIEASLTLKV